MSPNVSYNYTFYIQWENRYSHQTGYVRDLLAQHFVNTFNEDEAKHFISRTSAEKMIEHLNEIGEGQNNIFTVIVQRNVTGGQVQ